MLIHLTRSFVNPNITALGFDTKVSVHTQPNHSAPQRKLNATTRSVRWTFIDHDKTWIGTTLNNNNNNNDKNNNQPKNNWVVTSSSLDNLKTIVSQELIFSSPRMLQETELKNHSKLYAHLTTQWEPNAVEFYHHMYKNVVELLVTRGQRAIIWFLENIGKSSTIK